MPSALSLCTSSIGVAVMVALAAGQHERAEAAASGITDAFWGPVALARVALAQGDAAGATVLLGRAGPRSPRQLVIHDLLLSRVASRAEESVEAVRRAAARAARHGMVQTVAMESLWDANLPERLERVADSVPAPWLDRVRHGCSPLSVGTGTLASAAVPAMQTKSSAAKPAPPLPAVEGYTDRLSYFPGEMVRFHVSSETPRFSLEIARIGAKREVVW